MAEPNEKTNLVNENKSSLPSDDTSPSSKDLDDEILFKNKMENLSTKQFSKTNFSLR